MEPRKLCEEAWQEIASKFPDFKVLAKGQKLKILFLKYTFRQAGTIANIA